MRASSATPSRDRSTPRRAGRREADRGAGASARGRSQSRQPGVGCGQDPEPKPTVEQKPSATRDDRPYDDAAEMPEGSLDRRLRLADSRHRVATRDGPSSWLGVDGRLQAAQPNESASRRVSRGRSPRRQASPPTARTTARRRCCACSRPRSRVTAVDARARRRPQTSHRDWYDRGHSIAGCTGAASGGTVRAAREGEAGAIRADHERSRHRRGKAGSLHGPGRHGHGAICAP